MYPVVILINKLPFIGSLSLIPSDDSLAEFVVAGLVTVINDVPDFETDVGTDGFISEDACNFVILGTFRMCLFEILFFPRMTNDGTLRFEAIKESITK